jgi:hypothetical protein
MSSAANLFSTMPVAFETETVAQVRKIPNQATGILQMILLKIML